MRNIAQQKKKCLFFILKWNVNDRGIPSGKYFHDDKIYRWWRAGEWLLTPEAAPENKCVADTGVDADVGAPGPVRPVMESLQ